MNHEAYRQVLDLPIRLDGAPADSSEARGTRREFKPRELRFYGTSSRSWIVPDDEGPARAVQVLVMKVSGVARVARGHRYRVRFEVSLKEDAFGWQDSPVRVSAKRGSGGRYQRRQVDLSRVSTIPQKIPAEDQALQIEVPSNCDDDRIYFGLYEFSRRKWKGGLLIHSAIVEPVD